MLILYNRDNHVTNLMKKSLLIPISIFGLAVSTLSAEFDLASYRSALKSQDAPALVATQTKLNPSDVVVIVKEAIVQTEASANEVAEIVKAAITASPKQARVIYVAALSVAPDAHDEIMKVYYAFAPNSGDGVSDAKGAKGGKTEVGSEGDDIITPNPLDFPTGLAGTTGPTPGGPGGFPLLPIASDPRTIPPVPIGPPVSNF